jgi:hypothetical protein
MERQPPNPSATAAWSSNPGNFAGLASKPMTIRTAQFEDAARIAHIHVTTWRMAYAGIIPDEFLASLSVEDRIKNWREQLVDGRTVVFVAEKSGQMLGWQRAGSAATPMDRARLRFMQSMFCPITGAAA